MKLKTENIFFKYTLVKVKERLVIVSVDMSDC